ncbi:MAG: phosphatase PAP2 family protein, partial [Nitrospira sp.]|nr:phosphatase PAP2 family protein [Nitrospira sp.]
MGHTDTLIFFFINRDLQNHFFDVIMPFITNRAYLLIVPLVLWCLLKDWKKAGIVLLISVAALALSDWIVYMVKEIFQRPRPCAVLDGVNLLVGCGRSYSMPSSHASSAISFVTPFLFLVKSRIRYPLILIALFVMFSRVYVGVHYPSDVLVGAFLGFGLAVSVIGFYRISESRFRAKPYTTLLFVFLLCVSLFHIYYISRGYIDLSPDEAHYWEWSRRLDWSYYSKGPMIAYLISAGTSVFGDNVLGIRIMAVLFSSLSSIFLYLLGKKLFDEPAGLFSAILIQIIPLFSTFGVVFTIDSPFIFFWVVSLFLFWEAVDPLTPPLEKVNNPPMPPFSKGGVGGFVYWILLGVSIGFGLLTKYTMAFFYLCGFIYLLFSGKRKLIFTKGPLISSIISLIIFSPVIFWNAKHEWVTFRHTAGQVHGSEGFGISLQYFIEFLGSQFGVITPLLLILMIFALWKLRKQKEGAFLFWFFVPVIVFFLLKSLQAKVQANWALTGYISGIIAFSAVFKKFYAEAWGKRVLVITALLISVAVTSIAHFPSLLNLPQKQDPTSRLRGWKELGAEVTKIYEEMSAAGPVFIFSDRYQVSSEVAFYVKGHPITYCINLGRRMNQYDLWPGFNNLLHHNAIFV